MSYRFLVLCVVMAVATFVSGCANSGVARDPLDGTPKQRLYEAAEAEVRSQDLAAQAAGQPALDPIKRELLVNALAADWESQARQEIAERELNRATRTSQGTSVDGAWYKARQSTRRAIRHYK